MSNASELAKLQCLQTLFGRATGGDPYLAQQIKKAIDFSLTGSVDQSAPLERFTEAALRLGREYRTMPPSCRICHLDFREKEYDPLWIHRELSRIFRELAGYDSALLIVTGLRCAICPPGRYWTKKYRNQYRAAIEYIDTTAALRSARNTTANIIYV